MGKYYTQEVYNKLVVLNPKDTSGIVWKKATEDFRHNHPELPEVEDVYEEYPDFRPEFCSWVDEEYSRTALATLKEEKQKCFDEADKYAKDYSKLGFFKKCKAEKPDPMVSFAIAADFQPHIDSFEGRLRDRHQFILVNYANPKYLSDDDKFQLAVATIKANLIAELDEIKATVPEKDGKLHLGPEFDYWTVAKTCGNIYYDFFTMSRKDIECLNHNATLAIAKDKRFLHKMTDHAMTSGFKDWRKCNDTEGIKYDIVAFIAEYAEENAQGSQDGQKK